jgi:hypothetical protein
MMGTLHAFSQCSQLRENEFFSKYLFGGEPAWDQIEFDDEVRMNENK